MPGIRKSDLQIQPACQMIDLFENRVLRTMVGSKRKGRIKEYRKLQNEKIHNLYASSNITEVISFMEDGMGRTYSTYVGNKKFQ